MASARGLKQIVTPGGQTGQETNVRLIGDFLFLILFFLLIGLWLMMWIGFHLVGGVIHLLLIIAAISLIVHLFSRRRAA